MINKFFKDAEFIILDGCDEAIGFGPWLSKEIKSLSFSHSVSEKVAIKGFINAYVPPDLYAKIKFNNKSKKVSIVKPLSELDFERLAVANKGPVGDAIKKLLAKYRKENRKIVLTSRVSVPLDLSKDFFVTTLKGFSDRQLEQFYKKWFAGTDKSNEDVLGFLDKHEYLKETSRLPMIATIIAAIHENGYDLPHSKSDLYGKRFDLLLDKWQLIKGVSFRGRVKAEDKFVLLMRMALALHFAHRRRFQKGDLERIWNEGFSRIYPDYSCEELMWELQVGNGIIYPEGGGEYSLGHLSYQEFLVANAIMRTQRQNYLAGKYFDPWWKNVIIFYAGVCGDVSTLLEAIHSRHTLVDEKGLISDIVSEARFTSPVVIDFLRDGLETDLFKDKDFSER